MIAFVEQLLKNDKVYFREIPLMRTLVRMHAEEKYDIYVCDQNAIV
jgi:hypothetical protein